MIDKGETNTMWAEKWGENRMRSDKLAKKKIIVSKKIDSSLVNAHVQVVVNN